MNKECRNCRYFALSAGVVIAAQQKEYGQCRRYPPEIAGFPCVHVKQWCGEHKKPEAKKEQIRPSKEACDVADFLHQMKCKSTGKEWILHPSTRAADAKQFDTLYKKGFDYKDMKRAIYLAHNDEFWRKYIHTGAKVAQKITQLLALDNTPKRQRLEVCE